MVQIILTAIVLIKLAFMQRSRGYIENISISGSTANLYAENSDVGIDGGTFSSSGKEAITPRNGSRFNH